MILARKSPELEASSVPSSTEAILAESGRLLEAGDVEAAARVLVTAEREDPDNLPIVHELARAMMALRSFEDALRLIQRVVAAQPGNSGARADHGAILAALGNFDGALDELEFAAALEVNNEAAQSGVQIVRGILAQRGGVSRPHDENLPPPLGSLSTPEILVPGRNVWFVGNSQLITSILRAYASPEDAARIGEDWQEKRISRGEIRIDENLSAGYVCCNMTLLGDPVVVGDRIRHSATMRSFVASVDPAATDIVVMLRGNEYGILALADSGSKWDFHYRGVPTAVGRQYVPTSDVIAHLEQISSALLASCLLFRRAYPNARIHHILAPPPVESEEHILANPEIFGHLFAEHGLRPFPARKKLYDAMYEHLAQRLAERDVTTIPAPGACLTEAGGLRSEYAHGCLHGNEHYGRALVAALRGVQDASVQVAAR